MLLEEKRKRDMNARGLKNQTTHAERRTMTQHFLHTEWSRFVILKLGACTHPICLLNLRCVMENLNNKLF